MIRRALVIANPGSRRGAARAEAVRDTLDGRGIECALALTERPGHAAELAAAARSGHDAVFAVGGDGTAMEVAGALSGSRCAVGVIPAGTGNLLARALGIPYDVREAVESLVTGTRLALDLGRLDSGRSFAIAAGVGIDAAMIADTPTWLKQRLGVLAYVITGSRAALRAVLTEGAFTARVTVDGETTECAASTVMVANFGALLGGRITLGSGIRADDGVMDVCVFAPRSVRDVLDIAWRLATRDFSPTPALTYRRGRTIRVETDPAMPSQADGELLGWGPLVITVQPRCVALLVPRPG